MQLLETLCLQHGVAWDTNMGECSTYTDENAISCYTEFNGIAVWRVCEECHRCSGRGSLGIDFFFSDDDAWILDFALFTCVTCIALFIATCRVP